MPSLSRHGHQFDLNANRYDSVSEVQQTLAESLYQCISEKAKGAKEPVLDIGAGTGHLSMRLASMATELHILDLSAEMLSLAEARILEKHPSLPVVKHVADIEAWPWNAKPFGIIVSSAALQWFRDVPAFLEKCKKLLKQGGLIGLGTFGHQSLKELHESYRQATGNPLMAGTRMWSSGELAALLSQNGFSMIESHSAIASTRYDSPRELLRGLKWMGVTGSTSNRALSKKNLSALLQDLEKTSKRSDGKYYLTWELVWLVAKTPSK
jgi:malonyl-CoA O-methyltransferase